jgi:hypothetical protein
LLARARHGCEGKQEESADQYASHEIAAQLPEIVIVPVRLDGHPQQPIPATFAQQHAP